MARTTRNGIKIEPIPDENRLAARAVALREDIPASERREMLDMLGLTDGSEIRPSPPQSTRAALGSVHGDIKTRIVHHEDSNMKIPIKDRSRLPAGLRELPGVSR